MADERAHHTGLLTMSLPAPVCGIQYLPGLLSAVELALIAPQGWPFGRSGMVAAPTLRGNERMYA
jgi:hypothetical protein